MTSSRCVFVMDNGFVLTLDRELAVPVGTQIRGQIEYGIAIGELRGGTRLPSVRELAAGLSVAPATVSQVFKDLRARGMLQGRQGSGTFVPDVPPPHELGGITILHRGVDNLFAQAQEQGLTRAQVAEAVALRANQARGAEAGLTVLFVGIYANATGGYVAAIRPRLRRHDTIRGTTFRAFQARTSATANDVYVTLAHRAAELRELVGPTPPIVSATFVPTRDTRMRLAAIDPDARVAIVAGVPSFLPTLQRNVGRFAPHVVQKRATTPESDDFAATLSWCEAAVFGTSAYERLVSAAPAERFEFRFEPEARFIEETLLPTLENVRQQRTRGGAA